MNEQTRIGAAPEQIKPPEPVSDVLRLFEPAPDQIPGQLAMSAPTTESENR